MSREETEKKLHDRWSRGETLSAAENAQLVAWYARQDKAEANLLSKPSLDTDLEILQRQVDAASTQLTAVTDRIQQVTSENSAIRQEVTRLRQQLANQRHPV